MNTKTRNRRNVPRFYKELGKTAVQAYLRRKAAGMSTRHFSLIYGTTKYVFWTIGYDGYGNQIQMRTSVDRIMRRISRYCEKTGATPGNSSQGLYYLSFNKPEVDA